MGNKVYKSKRCLWEDCGRETTEWLMQKYYELDYDVFDEPARENFKDYNEYLRDLTLKKIEVRR